MNRIYMCIDLKSFYASVECRERNLDPLKTNLVVADESRTEKTVCLAVSPSLKQYGIGGRARLYEVLKKVEEINRERKRKNKYKEFTGKSYLDYELKNDISLELDFIIAPPRMSYYMNYSTKIYNIYLKYIAPEDIYVYSIDEVFCDITNYLKFYNMTPRELVTKMIKDVYDTTGITATAGIGTNLFLAKVAMDVVAKHTEPNEFGVRIAGLDEMSYRKKIWEHKPITDIWRVGKGTADRLEKYNIYTMGDIARCSIENEDLLYKLFGVNAELLIDHAWGYEPCTIKSIKEYKPTTKSISSGQVLHCPYNYKQTKIIIKEMADLIALDLVDKGVMTDQLVLTIGYDIENLTKSNINYSGEVTLDQYGRKIPKHSHGTIKIEHKTSSSSLIMNKLLELYERIVNKDLLIRRINISANRIESESNCIKKPTMKQFNLFSSLEEQEKEYEQEYEKEKNKIMKTQKKTFLMMVFFFMVAYIPKVSATAIDTIYVVANTTTENHQICSSVNDSVMMHCPIGHTGVRWMDPSSDITDGPDSVFVKNNNEGHWMFYSDQLGTWKDIYVYLVSIPYEPASMADDTTICTTSLSIVLNAENPASSYTWSTGQTTQNITVNAVGTYTVTVTNTCGTSVYSKTITYDNPNALDLGPNQSFCWGSNSVLDPESNNVATHEWSTGDTTPTITVDTTGTYWVFVENTDGCNGRDTIQITALIPTPEEICYVEFDTVTWKNNINWTSDLPGNADSVRIYKEDGINWMPIGTVYKTTTKFLDMASNPQAQSYSYRIAIIDTCGNESILSSHHKTITLLSTYDQPSNTYGFTWSYYEGLVVEYYYLYGIDASNNVYPVDTLNGSDHMYNYIGPNPAFVKYYVGFETPDCNGSKANVIVKSNWVDRDTLVTAMREENIISFSVYPNPADEQLNLTIDCKDFQVEISTMLGQVLLSEQNAKILNVGTLPQGIYIISITADGIKSNLRFIKN